jgi:hypothetical protein
MMRATGLLNLHLGYADEKGVLVLRTVVPRLVPDCFEVPERARDLRVSVWGWVPAVYADEAWLVRHAEALAPAAWTAKLIDKDGEFHLYRLDGLRRS